jgi:hypothetical protein
MQRHEAPVLALARHGLKSEYGYLSSFSVFSQKFTYFPRMTLVGLADTEVKEARVS